MTDDLIRALDRAIIDSMNCVQISARQKLSEIQCECPE